MLWSISEAVTLLINFFRSSHRRCSVEIGVLKSFANFTGKHLRWSLFLISCNRFFLWNLRNFYEDLFWRTSANNCSWRNPFVGSVWNLKLVYCMKQLLNQLFWKKKGKLCRISDNLSKSYIFIDFRG